MCGGGGDIFTVTDSLEKLNLRYDLGDAAVPAEDCVSNELHGRRLLSAACTYLFNTLSAHAQGIRKSATWSSLRKAILGDYTVDLLTIISDCASCAFFEEYLLGVSSSLSAASAAVTVTVTVTVRPVTVTAVTYGHNTDTNCLKCWREARNIQMMLKIFLGGSGGNSSNSSNSSRYPTATPLTPAATSAATISAATVPVPVPVTRFRGHEYAALEMLIEFVLHLHRHITSHSTDHGVSTSTKLSISAVIETVTCIRDPHSLDREYAVHLLSSLDDLVLTMERETFLHLQTKFNGFLSSDTYVAWVARSTRMHASRQIQDHRRKVSFLNEVSYSCSLQSTIPVFPYNLNIPPPLSLSSPKT